jgi:tRNA G18 (ribose-2'-O)-methylase SpoU
VRGRGSAWRGVRDCGMVTLTSMQDDEEPLLRQIQQHFDSFSLMMKASPAAATATTTTTLAKPDASPPQFYLILHDIMKSTNAGSLLRTASAFNCRGILCVGGQHKRIRSFGAHGAQHRLEYWFFHTLAQAVDWAMTQLGCLDVVGVEIRPDAISVASPQAFRGTSAFLLGNEGSGLRAAHAKFCTRFVYVPQHGSGTASLNVVVAAGVVFHRFASFAQFPERNREGEKFVVDDAIRDGSNYHYPEPMLRSGSPDEREEGLLWLGDGDF